MRHPASGYRRQTSHGVGHKDGVKESGYPTRCEFGDDCLFGGRLVYGSSGLPSIWDYTDDVTGRRVGFHTECMKKAGRWP